jgi:hypothetical protein
MPLRLRGRASWHPLTIATVIVVATCAAAGAGLPPALWLMMGAAAGFATSGST